MNLTMVTWLFLRVLRWASWIVFFGFAIYFVHDRTPHINSFNNLLRLSEAMMFGPPILAVFAGFLELMMREKTGLPRPAFGRNWWG